MKLLWLCNCAPGVVADQLTGGSRGAVNWVDHVLLALRQRGDFTIRVLFPGAGEPGALDETCSYRPFQEKHPQKYAPALEELFYQELKSFQPDVIHSWGVEYGHTLAMAMAAERAELLPQMAASIQGLCSVCARHYAQGLPWTVTYGFTIRDFLRQDNIAQQREIFAQRGILEDLALGKIPTILGRTHWDYGWTRDKAPSAAYRLQRETLRQEFYQGQWRYEACQKHRIFAPSCGYPIKGFHYLLEAFAQVLKTYPDAVLAVPGQSFLEWTPRRGSYHRYLAKLVKQYQLAGKVEFLGKCSAQQMRQQLLLCNAFALPSVMENSSNSLGEAMLLGVPAVAAWVGGIPSLMEHGKEGFLYPAAEPEQLASYLCEIFELGQRAEALGEAARTRGAATHDPERNLEDLLKIYQEIRR